MNRNLGFAIAFLSLLAGVFMKSSSASASIDERASAFVLCKNKKDVRTIRILADGDKTENCKITYSKGGIEEIVGSNRSLGSCKSIMKSIQSNLESAAWSCRSVQTAHITTGAQAVAQ